MMRRVSKIAVLTTMLSVVSAFSLPGAAWAAAKNRLNVPKKIPGTGKSKICHGCTCCKETKVVKTDTKKITVHPENGHILRIEGDKAAAPNSVKLSERVSTFATKTLSVLSRQGPESAQRADTLRAASSSDTGAAAPTGPARFGTKVSRAVLTFIDGFKWREHHPWWHAIHRWEDLSQDEQSSLVAAGWQPPRDDQGKVYMQEGQPGNGLKFGAMHGAVTQKLIDSGFDGALPAFTRADYQRLKALRGVSQDDDTAIEMLLGLIEARNPTDAGAVAIKNKFRTLDDFSNWIESQRAEENPNMTSYLSQADLAIAGVHNRIHVALSDPNSPIDMGDPGKNMGNKDFWGWHRLINNALENYKNWFSSPSEKAQYDQLKTDELARMDRTTTDGQRVADAIDKAQEFLTSGKPEHAAHKANLESVLKKIQPIAQVKDLPPRLRSHPDVQPQQ